MPDIVSILLTLSVGTVGAWIATRLKIPAGAMLGSMLLVTMFNVITGYAHIPQDAKVISQIIAGAFIGVGIYKKDILNIVKIISPAGIMVVGMIVFSLAVGVIFKLVSGLDLTTSLFSCAPGGLMDITLISQDMGADSTKVVLLQTVRLMTVISFFPAIIKFFARHFDKGRVEIAAEKPIIQAVELSKKEKVANMTLTMSVAVVFGFIGLLVGIPAGAMIFSMIAVGVLNVIFARGFLYKPVKLFAQILAGAIIGERMTFADFIGMKDLMVPAVLMIMGFLIMNIAMALLIKKVSGIDLTTALLACAPGGTSEMTLAAGDMGADVPKVAVIQLIRMLSIVMFYPVVTRLLLNLVL